ncbi:MAG: hypothetical protein M1147_08640 [Nitrospirae bacterium]|nr:hypothetical protein [Nitrospirota bacterium]MCL5978167.1 hypothetical protein [Nitrospirota bacterium]
MKTSRIISAVTVIISILCWASFSSADCVAWKETEQIIRANWAKKYPGEKILKIERTGESSVYEKEIGTGKTKKDPRTGDIYEYFVKVPFCQEPVRVHVERASGTKVEFNTSWHFKKVENKYVYSHFSVGAVTEVAKKGQEAPPKDEIKKMVAEAWVRDMQATDKVRKVLLSDPEFNQYKDRWWYWLEGDVFVTNAEGQNQKCKDLKMQLFRDEKGSEGKDAGAPWRVKFVSETKGYCPNE